MESATSGNSVGGVRRTRTQTYRPAQRVSARRSVAEQSDEPALRIFGVRRTLLGTSLSRNGASRTTEQEAHATTNPYDSTGRRHLAIAADRLDRQGWTFDNLRVSEIIERIDEDDNELFARLLDATRAGDQHAGTVALYAVLPRLLTSVRATTGRTCRTRALDETLGFAWIVITEPGNPLPRNRSIHLFISRVRFRARRSVNPHRVDRPHLTEREISHAPELLDGLSYSPRQDFDPTGDKVLRRLEVERLGRAVHEAIEDGAIEADNWTALLDARVLGVTPHCEYRSQSGTWTAIWRTVHRVRTLTDVNA
ncbi:MAG: hypothetical protein R2705_24585 [Ilumatobacteraceae bacterium]